MRIIKFIDVGDVEVQIDIDASDIDEILREAPDSKRAVINMVNTLASVMRATPDALITELTEKQRQTISVFLSEQAARFTAP